MRRDAPELAAADLLLHDGLHAEGGLQQPRVILDELLKLLNVDLFLLIASAHDVDLAHDGGRHRILFILTTIRFLCRRDKKEAGRAPEESKTTSALRIQHGCSHALPCAHARRPPAQNDDRCSQAKPGLTSKNRAMRYFMQTS